MSGDGSASRKSGQLSSIIHRAVQQVLSGGLSDPRLDAMITITDVRVGPDLRQATVRVSIMPAERESRAMHGLRDAARHIRREAAELVDLHRMPELVFKIDRSIKKHAAVLDALARVREERGEDGADATENPNASVSGEDPNT